MHLVTRVAPITSNAVRQIALMRSALPRTPINFLLQAQLRHASSGKTADNILVRRLNWWREQWRTNKTGLALHISLLASILAVYNYFLREHLEPYLPSAIQPPGSEPLHPQRFRRFDLTSRIPFSETSSLFTMGVHGPAWMKTKMDYDAAWKSGVWSVEIKQPQLQIARSYTPLPPLLAQDEVATARDPSDLRFLIRKEHQGEVSGYLHRLPVGADHVEIRGPHLEFELPANVGEVVFLAGGTGIAPAMQIAYSLLRRPSGQAKMKILWANRTREDAYSFDGGSGGSSGALLDQLKDIAARGTKNNKLALEVKAFVDADGSFISKKDLASAITAAETMDGKPRLILISGPDGFIKYLSGPKVMRNGIELQGPVGGLLQEIDRSNWEVWKF